MYMFIYMFICACAAWHLLHLYCIYTASTPTDRQIDRDNAAQLKHCQLLDRSPRCCATAHARRTRSQGAPDGCLFLALVPVAARVLLHCVVLRSYICIHQGGLKSEYEIRLILSLKANTVFCIQHVPVGYRYCNRHARNAFEVFLPKPAA